MGNDMFQIKMDDVEGLGSNFIQLQGKGRFEVLDLAKRLDLGDTYIPYPYIEQVQLENMTEQMREQTADMLRGDFNLPGLDDLDELVSVSPMKTTTSDRYYDTDDMYGRSSSSGSMESNKFQRSKSSAHLNDLSKKVEELTKQVTAMSPLQESGTINSKGDQDMKDVVLALLKSQQETSAQISGLTRIIGGASVMLALALAVKALKGT